MLKRTVLLSLVVLLSFALVSCGEHPNDEANEAGGDAVVVAGEDVLYHEYESG